MNGYGDMDGREQMANLVLTGGEMLSSQTNPVLNGVDLNAIYQELLGRQPDEVGMQGFAGMAEDYIRAAILSSPEYAQRQADLAKLDSSSDSGMMRYVPTGPEGVGDIYGDVYRVWDKPWADYYRQARNDVEGIQRMPGVFSAYQNVPIAEPDIQQAFYPAGMQPNISHPVFQELAKAKEDKSGTAS